MLTQACELMRLARPYASDARRSRGRRIAETGDVPRERYQRDRDRIVHSTAFRRLVYKTQVFLNHEGDLFRTRLTHSLEVAQLGRSIARTLRLNEDLVEAIALAHDLGHTPFGHAGQDALNDCMRDARRLRAQPAKPARGRFAGGALSRLRRPEPDLRNARRHPQALLAQPCRSDWKRTSRAASGQRFLHGTQPSLEAQLCNLADEIAYNAHDIDDGVRSGLITREQLCEVPLFRRFHEQALAEFPASGGPGAAPPPAVRDHPPHAGGAWPTT